MSDLDPFKRIACLNLSRLKHTEVPSAAPAFHDARDHPLGPEAVIDLPARLARLADLDQRTSELEAVANVDRAFDKPAHRNVRPERPRLIEQRRIGHLVGPIGVMIERVEMQRLFHPAVNTPVGLFVACIVCFIMV